MESPPEGARSGHRTRFAEGTAEEGDDLVAHEEPLEIQVGGTPLAVVMRTPGHDRELALGFLVTERVVEGPADVVSLAHESVAPDPEGAENSIRVVLRDGLVPDLERLRRNLFASSSCGICGKATIENALSAAPPLEDDAHFDAGFFATLPEQMRARQALFARTGGLHAAALFDSQGSMLVLREDVGRHNAVDKVIGWAAGHERLPLHGHALLASGRISYEIVQKALAARIPVVAAVSAPTSLAVELASASGMALVAFLRDGHFSAYGNASRIRGDGQP